MGCDIHITVESRDATGVWTKHDDHPEFMSERWYGVFSVLAGVRRRQPDRVAERITPENRGLPSDFVGPERDEYEADGHSANWLWLYEMDRYCHGPFTEDQVAIKQWFEKAVLWMRTLGASDDVRMVFFFDN